MNPLKIDRKRIAFRIREIEKRLKLLSKLAESHSQTQFLVDETIAAAAERHLQIAIQACLDIADHLIAKLSLKLPQKDKKEVFGILAEEKIIPSQLGTQLAKMAGMRNILVHEYLEIQREKVHQTIKEDLGDIVKFTSAIQKFLDNKVK